LLFYDVYTAPGEKWEGCLLALLDVGRSRVACLPKAPTSVNRASGAEERQRGWQRTALEIAGTFLVLMGIAVGVVTLRLALVLMHGIVQ
jgi:hypothetical protein